MYVGNKEYDHWKFGTNYLQMYSTDPVLRGNVNRGNLE